MTQPPITPAPPAAQPPVCQFPMYYPHGYDHALACELASLVNEAYLNWESDDPETQPTPAGYDEVQPIMGGYTPQTLGDWILVIWQAIRSKKLPRYPAYFGFVARRGDDVVLVFRGTDSLLDALSDIHTSQALFYDDLRRRQPAPSTEFDTESAAEAAATERWKAARLEQGVWDIYRTLRVNATKAVQRCWAPGRRLFITGHSLGAGLAIAAIPDVIRNTGFKGGQRPDVYTFAGPRVANREFALAVMQENITCYRVVHTEDIVPTMPSPIPVKWLEGMMKGTWYYTHVGIPVDFAFVYPPGEKCTIVMNHQLTTYMRALNEQSATEARLLGVRSPSRTAELTSP